MPRTAAPSVLALLLGACQFPPPPDVNDDGRPPPGDGGATDARALAPMIAFTSDRTGNFDVFTMRIDGTDVVNLTDNPADDQAPEWSPGADRIAFVSTRSGSSEIYIISATGGAATNVSHGRAEAPVWSPDGSSLLFVSNRNGPYQIFRATLDGTAPSPLLTQEAGGPAWSPDGARIAFAGGDGIMTMNANGTDVRRLSTGTDGGPRWKPDGVAIAFTRRIMFGNNDLHIITPDGAAILDSPGPLGISLDLRWSPDGARVAMWGGLDSNYEIHVWNTITNSIAAISNLPGTDSDPEWSPDGSTIAFHNEGEIWRVHPNGSQLTNLTDTPSQEFDARWRPMP